ncbi:hypothetical protein FD755_013720 [Muntiacus reevesi]|uniref:EF-hand domain-containing protein n=1 Tax=Muntiacus reevesi TaxID=9886 RepID=A0A5N3XNM2_MUNRE|nr:hypothetical protein FD755_013720 [Muntiacus reevesi]
MCGYVQEILFFVCVSLTIFSSSNVSSNKLFCSTPFCRNDLLMVCRQLNMEESVAEIMNQLGADENGKICFQDFTRCRMQLIREIRKEEIDLSEKSDNSWKRKKLRDRIASWPTSSDNSLGYSVHGISQAGILEWVAISSPKGSS